MQGEVVSLVLGTFDRMAAAHKAMACTGRAHVTFTGYSHDEL